MLILLTQADVHHPSSASALRMKREELSFMDAFIYWAMNTIALWYKGFVWSSELKLAPAALYENTHALEHQIMRQCLCLNHGKANIGGGGGVWNCMTQCRIDRVPISQFRHSCYKGWNLEKPNRLSRYIAMAHCFGTLCNPSTSNVRVAYMNIVACNCIQPIIQHRFRKCLRLLSNIFPSHANFIKLTTSVFTQTYLLCHNKYLNKRISFQYSCLAPEVIAEVLIRNLLLKDVRRWGRSSFPSLSNGC